MQIISLGSYQYLLLINSGKSGNISLCAKKQLTNQQILQL